MSYNPIFEATKALPVEHIAKELEDFAATGQDLFGGRFNRSPPSVPSVPTTTYEESESPSPNAQLQFKETEELEHSSADAQFVIQIEDELGRIRAAREKGLLQQPDFFDSREAAEANVKYRWIQQGIWDERWESLPHKEWKHELQDRQSSMTPSGSVEACGDTDLRRMHKRKHSELVEGYHELVRRAVDYQNRQSSRPCYQFLYQFCQEREWIKLGLIDQDQDQQTNLDTTAYEIVKSRWTRDGIWDNDWTFVPGTSWRHERPRKTLDPRGTYRSHDAYKAARIEKAECPPRWYSMAPTALLTRINWLSVRSDPSTLEPSSKVRPFPREKSMKSRTHGHTVSTRSTRNSVAKAEPSPNDQEHDRSREKSTANEAFVNPTSTSPKKKALQKRKGNTSQPCIAESKPSRKRNLVNKEKRGPPTPLVRQNETATDLAASRPRRAAALKAMKNLTRSA